MSNKQNPGDSSGFRLSGSSQAAPSANSRLVLPYTPDHSNAPRLAGREPSQNAHQKPTPRERGGHGHRPAARCGRRRSEGEAASASALRGVSNLGQFFGNSPAGEPAPLWDGLRTARPSLLLQGGAGAHRRAGEPGRGEERSRAPLWRDELPISSEMNLV